MLEVFWCSAPKTNTREALAEATRAWWKSQPCKFVEVTPGTIRCSLERFQRERRIWADREASAPYYILTDDDCLPCRPSTIKTGINALIDYPQFAILSAWPINAGIGRWTPENYEPFEDLSVTEHVSVGGLRFCRKNALIDWPESTGPGYDMEQAIALRSKGLRVGYAQHSRYWHLGEGESETWG